MAREARQIADWRFRSRITDNMGCIMRSTGVWISTLWEKKNKDPIDHEKTHHPLKYLQRRLRRLHRLPVDRKRTREARPLRSSHSIPRPIRHPSTHPSPTPARHPISRLSLERARSDRSGGRNSRLLLRVDVRRDDDFRPVQSVAGAGGRSVARTSVGERGRSGLALAVGCLCRGRDLARRGARRSRAGSGSGAAFMFSLDRQRALIQIIGEVLRIPLVDLIDRIRDIARHRDEADQQRRNSMGLHLSLEVPGDPAVDLLAEADQHDGERVVGEVADDGDQADQGRVAELEDAEVDQVVEVVLAAEDFEVDLLVVLAERFGREASLLDGLLFAVLVFDGEVDVIWVLGCGQHDVTAMDLGNDAASPRHRSGSSSPSLGSGCRRTLRWLPPSCNLGEDDGRDGDRLIVSNLLFRSGRICGGRRSLYGMLVNQRAPMRNSV